MFLEN